MSLNPIPQSCPIFSNMKRGSVSLLIKTFQRLLINQNKSPNPLTCIWYDNLSCPPLGSRSPWLTRLSHTSLSAVSPTHSPTNLVWEPHFPDSHLAYCLFTFVSLLKCHFVRAASCYLFKTARPPCLLLCTATPSTSSLYLPILRWPRKWAVLVTALTKATKISWVTMCSMKFLLKKFSLSMRLTKIILQTNYTSQS